MKLHAIIKQDEDGWTLSIPQHKELGRGLLCKLLLQADLTVEEFNQV
jgi:hypothetical protein